MSHTKRFFAITIFLAIFFSHGLPLHAEIRLTLTQSFIEKYKNRATIKAECVVDHSKGKANPASKDGDMHIAVRCPDEIQLPLVAEIMNAKEYPATLAKTKHDEESQDNVVIAGAWRIWNEHGGDEAFVQGKKVPAAENTNPDHVFEIHPMTSYGEADLRASFHPIDGFETKDAEQAFTSYEAKQSTITYNDTKKTVTITSTGLGYNYVDFQIVLNESPQKNKAGDGYLVMAKVRDTHGHLLHRQRRMIFVEGTPPAEKVKTLKKDDCIHVLGIPRLDLALVSYRVNQARQGNKTPLKWNLPYEMIVAGTYDEACEDD